MAPQAKDAHYGLALAYMSLGRDAQAEPHFRQAIELDPKWSNPKNALASLLIRSRRCPEAETLLRKTLDDIFYLTPEFARHNLARALVCQGKSPEAIKELDTLLARRPQFCLGYLTLAQISSDEKMPDRTIKSCEAFTTQCEAHQEIAKQISADHSCYCLHKKGVAYAELGDVESAQAALSGCRGDAPNCRECFAALQLLSR